MGPPPNTRRALTPPAAAVLSLCGLSVTVGGRKVLHNIDLDVPPHAITTLIGRSGSGKSTLLRTLNRLILLAPGVRVEGRVLLGSVDLLGPDLPDAEVRRRLGAWCPGAGPAAGLDPRQFRFRDAPARPTRSARDREPGRGGAGPGRAVGVAKRPRTRSITGRIAARVGQQLLCIARALVIGAEVLLLDDPTKGIDWAAAGVVADPGQLAQGRGDRR